MIRAFSKPPLNFLLVMDCVHILSIDTESEKSGVLTCYCTSGSHSRWISLRPVESLSPRCGDSLVSSNQATSYNYIRASDPLLSF